jgi:hypothetical protein
MRRLFEMSTIEMSTIERALKGIPLNDKIGALICHLAERNMDSIAAILSLISAAAVIGKNLPDQADRRQCAMAIRDTAVEIESEYQPLVSRE